MNSRTGFTVDGQSVDFPLGMSQESEEEWDVNDDPDLDPAYMYARNSRAQIQGFDSASYPHYQYPDETQDNDYYQENNNNNNSRTNNNDADIIERYGMANGMDDLDEQDGEIKKMPEEYYSSLDVFLNKGPPRILRDRGGKGDSKLAANTNAKGKQVQSMPSKTAKKGVALAAGTANAGVPVITSYSAVKSSGYGPAATGGSKGKKQASGVGGRGAGGGGGLDEDLLKEAFAYTDKLLREAVLEEQEESQMMMTAAANKQPYALNNALNNNHSRGNHPHPVPPSKGPSSSSSHHSMAAAYAPASAPRPPPRSYGGSGSGSSGLTLSQLQGMNNVSVVQRLRDEVQGTTATHASSSSSMGGASAGGDAGSGLFRVSSVGLDQPEVLREGQAKADLASLVSNFESGATLAKLKAELEASQRARDKSRLP